MPTPGGSFQQPKDAARPSVWIKIDDPMFVSHFRVVFEEHIPGFGKVKRKRQPVGETMEWKVRLEQKRARNKSGKANTQAADRSSFASSSEFAM